MIYGQLQKAMPDQYASTLAGAAQQDRAPELPLLLERLEKSVAYLDDRASLLDSRMSGTVARQLTEAGNCASPKAVTNTGMGAALDAAADRVHLIAQRLDSLINRLEF